MKLPVGQISVDQARQLAIDAVISDKSHYETGEIERALEDEFLEAENCWIFFRSKEISVPSSNWFTKSYGAFAISKKGTFAQITAFENDREQLLVYLQKMSDYFGERDE